MYICILYEVKTTSSEGLVLYNFAVDNFKKIIAANATSWCT